MHKRISMLREPNRIIRNLQPHFLNQQFIVTSREEHATQVLLDLTQSQEQQRQRNQNNGSQITSWTQNYLNILSKQDYKKNKRPRQFRMKLQKKIQRENSFLETQTFQFKLGATIRQQINKLKLPLRQKTLNSEHFDSFQIQKQRSKTRNEVLLEIKNYKNQIGPVPLQLKKLASECTCSSIIKQRAESRYYQKIKRKEFQINSNLNSNNNENDGEEDWSQYKWQERHQSLTSKYQRPPQLVRLRGRSIKKLFEQ